MTDLEMTKLCAEAMGKTIWWSAQGEPMDEHGFYSPLHDDVQAMALMKRYIDTYDALVNPNGYRVRSINGDWTTDADLNRAIVRCVSQMQLAKAQHENSSAEIS